MESTVLNLFGGPGALKSTIASGVFTLLKLHNINCELVTEVAKDFVWDNHTRGLQDQQYVFGKQNHRIWRLSNLVDVIIADSPLPLSIVYKPNDLSESFDTLVLDTFNKYKNINILIKRKEEIDYGVIGRNQTMSEAKEIDNSVELMLYKYNIPYSIFSADYSVINNLTKLMLDYLEVPQKYTVKEG